MNRLSFIYFLIIGALNVSFAQVDPFLFTKSFTFKLEYNDLEFFLPVENTLLPTPLQKDDFFKYDIALHGTDGVEVRIFIDEFNKKKARVPTVRFSSALASMATNDQEESIALRIFRSDDAISFFNAEWAAMAEFIPKASLSNKKYGFLQSIYLSDRAQVFVMILHDQKELPIAYSRLLQFHSNLASEE